MRRLWGIGDRAQGEEYIEACQRRVRMLMAPTFAGVPRERAKQFIVPSIHQILRKPAECQSAERAFREYGFRQIGLGAGRIPARDNPLSFLVERVGRKKVP